MDSGSRREKVGTGKGSGQFTPEIAINHPHALRELHEEFLNAGSEVLQALTFFGTREKLGRAGYGAETEHINHAAVKLAKEVAGDNALVAGSVSRTQLTEREGMASLDKSRDHIAEQIRFLKDAGVDFLVLETFFHLAEMEVALQCAADVGLPAFPDDLEMIQVSRHEFYDFGKIANNESIGSVGAAVAAMGRH